jgi:hypothetical protein
MISREIMLNTVTNARFFDVLVTVVLDALGSSVLSPQTPIQECIYHWRKIGMDGCQLGIHASILSFNSCSTGPSAARLSSSVFAPPRSRGNPKVVSERFGHSTLVLTFDTYSHVIQTMQQAATAPLEKLISSHEDANESDSTVTQVQNAG